MDFLKKFMDFLTKERNKMEIFRQPLFSHSHRDAEFKILRDGFVVTDETWKQNPLYAPYSRVYFVFEGSGMLVSGEEQMPLEPGYVYLAPCGTKCGFYGTDSVTKLFFHVNVSFLTEGSDAFEPITHFLKLPCDVEKMRELKQLYFSKEPFDHFRLGCYLRKTVCDFLLSTEQAQGGRRYFPKNLSDALAYIRGNLHAKLTATEVAQHAFCSVGTLNAIFRREIGQSISAYIDDLIMSEAQTMLLYSNHSVGEISERLGFCDQFYFSRCFTKRFSLSPQKFRKIQSAK